MKRALTLTLIALAAAVGLSTTAHAATLDEAAVSVTRMADSKPGPTRGYQLGWALMDYVHTNVSPTRYAKLTKKPVTVPEILETKAGICGSQIMTALAIADRIGLKARPVEFYGHTGAARWSHIAIEVWANGGWRFFDITWNTVYRKHPGSRTLMSIGGLRRLPAAERLSHKDTIGEDPWRDQYTREHGSVFTYATADRRDLDVTPGDSGTYRLPRTENGFRVGVNVPDTIGERPSYGARRTNLRIRLEGLRGNTVRLNVKAAVCASAGTLIARSQILSRTSFPNSLTPTIIDVPVRGGNVTLSVSGGCYMVLTGVTG